MGYRHRDSGVASPRFLHINTEKNLCLYLLFISYPLCLRKVNRMYLILIPHLIYQLISYS